MENQSEVTPDWDDEVPVVNDAEPEDAEIEHTAPPEEVLEEDE